MLLFTAKIDVWNGGYRWEDTGRTYLPDWVREGEQVQAASLRLVPASESVNVRTYDPFVTEPALFLNFSAVAPTEAAVLAFSDQYGYVPAGKGTIVSPSFTEYVEAIANLADAAHLWRAITAGDVEQLGQHVEWSGRKLRWVGPLGSVMPVMPRLPAGEPPVPFSPPKFKRGDLLLPAVTLLDRAISAYTGGASRFQPVRDHDGELRFSVSIECDFFNVLWWQFALAVAARTEFKTCGFCSRQFPSATTRSDREFCSDSCRVRAHNKRRAKVDELYRLGKKPKEIAKATGTDIETVKKWISTPKEK